MTALLIDKVIFVCKSNFRNSISYKEYLLFASKELRVFYRIRIKYSVELFDIDGFFALRTFKLHHAKTFVFL